MTRLVGVQVDGDQGGDQGPVDGRRVVATGRSRRRSRSPVHRRDWSGSPPPCGGGGALKGYLSPAAAPALAGLVGVGPRQIIGEVTLGDAGVISPADAPAPGRSASASRPSARSFVPRRQAPTRGPHRPPGPRRATGVLRPPRRRPPRCRCTLATTVGHRRGGSPRHAPVPYRPLRSPRWMGRAPRVRRSAIDARAPEPLGRCGRL